MSTVSKERVTVSLSPWAISFLDRYKRVKRVSRSRAMELLIEERQRQERRKLFAAEAKVFFAQENPAHRKDADAMEKAALEDWSRRGT